MKPALELVSDRGAARSGSEGESHATHPPFVPPMLVPQPRGGGRRTSATRSTQGQRGLRVLRGLREDERGAVTAEYAIVIMAAVAFAGLLVAIMRSTEIREMLVNLVESALGAGG